jgi:DNA modification methylase
LTEGGVKHRQTAPSNTPTALFRTESQKYSIPENPYKLEAEGILMKLETIAIAELTPDPQNARQHDQTNLKAIEGSLREFGQRKPIVISQTNVIVAGNGTVEAAKRLGLTDIQAVRVPSDWDANRIKAFALADNRTAELADWSPQVLAEQLLEIEQAGFDIEAFGFEKVEPAEDRLEEEDDAIPDQVQTRVELGQLWQLGNHRLLCGDSTDAKAINKLFENRIAEICFTSPPYADQREYNGGKQLSTEHLASFISVASEFCKFFVVNLGIARKGNAISRYWDDYIFAAEKSGLRLLSWNVWNRQGLAGFSIAQITAMFAIEHEWIFVFGKESKKLNQTIQNKNAGASTAGSIRKKNGKLTRNSVEIAPMRQMGTIYSGGVETNPEGNHPATFPIDFPITYLEAMTNELDFVFEPFAGSGTTIIACEKLNRQCLGMELDPKYCDVIIQRWENLTGKKAELVNG